MQLRMERRMAVAALVATGWAWLPAPAAADSPLAGGDLALVMTAYVEGAVELRDLYATCASNPPAGWEEGAAILVESLRAAGLDASSVAAIGARLASAPDGKPVDCEAPEHALRAGSLTGTDWPAYHRAALEAAGIPVVRPTVGDERLVAAGAVVEEALPLQARMFECLSLFDPRGFVLLYVDWDRRVGEVAGRFADAGYAANAYEPILAPAAARNLFRAPADRAAAAASCAADQGWFERYATMSWYTLASDVEAALEGRKP